MHLDTDAYAWARSPLICVLCARCSAYTAFWGATFGFFTTFFSCFAPSALGTYYKRPASQGGLGLSPENLSDGGAFAVSGTIIMRIIAGPMCDVLGARLTFVTLLLVGIPGMIIFAVAQGPTAFILGRVVIGLSLATFVTCQVWCSQFFSKGIVGTVNATAGGWGNLGGAITLLVMPSIVNGFIDATTASMGNAKSIDFSWRMAMIIPACMHLITATYIFMGEPPRQEHPLPPRDVVAQPLRACT